MGTSEATDLVRPILDDVKERGAAALRDFEEKFDHVRPKHLRVPVEAIQDALATLDSEVRAAIEESVRRARAVAANQVPKDFYTDLAKYLNTRYVMKFLYSYSLSSIADRKSTRLNSSHRL